MRDYATRAADIMSDPVTPYWAKDLIRTCEGKDPVDAASILHLLADLMKQRCTELSRF